MANPLERLRHHVSGAIARGEAEPIVEVAPPRCVVIPSRVWKHVSGRTASIYGSTPWTSAADKPNWEMVTRGYTIQNPDGTIGCGKPPCATYEEAQALCDRLNAIRFPGMNQG